MTEEITQTMSHIPQESALASINTLLEDAKDNPNISVVVIFANSETSSIKVCGMNIDEMELPILLTETASEIGQKVLKDLEGRTLNWVLPYTSKTGLKLFNGLVMLSLF